MAERKLKTLKIAQEAVELGRKLGADEVEAYLQLSQLTTVKAHQGEIELYTTALTKGLGVRVFSASKMGYAFSSDLTKRAVRGTLREAVENAKVAQADQYNGLPKSLATEEEMQTELDICYPDFRKISPESKKDFTLSLEEKALKFDRRIVGTEAVVYADEDSKVVLANSSGFAGQFEKTSSYGFLSVLAREKGETQTGFSFALGQHLGELAGKKVSEEAAERAISLLKARSISPRMATVVFDSMASAQVLLAISSALTAEAAQKGRSFLSGKVGSKVASDMVTVIDDGRLRKGLGSQPCDDEGVSTGKTEVIKEGVLETFLYDTYTARKEKRLSTGNARRATFKSLPSALPTNLFFASGERSKGEIIGSISKGLYVLTVAGLHAGINAVTGQFSIGASGLWIEQGKTTFPVREVTIASTIQEILKNIVAVGSDLRFIPMGGSTGAPTLAVENMVISGR